MRRRRGYRLAQTAHERMVHGEREGCSAEDASASEPRSPRYRREYVPQSELACGGGSGAPGPPAPVGARS